MGALTLARLMWLEAARRPRALLTMLMLALSAGFLILPDPGADYATLTLHDHPLIYTPAVMGFITGGEFTAFSGALGVLAMTVVAPMAAWRIIQGVTAAPAWRVALGVWIAAFGVGLSMLICIWAGALLRAHAVLVQGGDPAGALWVFSSWAFGLGVAGAGVSATVYTLLSRRLATRPGFFMAATFIAWIVLLSPLLGERVDLTGMAFAGPHFLADFHRHEFGMGIIGGARSHAAVATLPVGDLFSSVGGAAFVLTRLSFVAVGLALAMMASGPALKPLVVRGRAGGAVSALGSSFSARWGLTGVIFRQVWSARLLTLAALAVAVTFETLHAGDPLGVVALGFAWGLYMLRWPELCAAFEHGALRSLVVPSVLGPWQVRAQLFAQVAVQLAVLALPLGIAFADRGRAGALVWLAAQILGAPLLCLGLARLRGGATVFSLAAMVWWYLLVSGNLAPPSG